MKIGIIGGGNILDYPDYMKVESEYGRSSEILEYRKINDIEIYTMRRHNYNHTISPHEVNYKANIDIFKKLKIDYLIGVSACGSLDSDINIGDIVLPNQMIDLTQGRKNTFSGKNRVIHTSMAEPYSVELRDKLYESIIKNKNHSKILHKDKVLVTIEGPHFLSKAESKYVSMIGSNIINMTTATEAKLAKEVNLKYQPLCLITDKDNQDENVELSMEYILKNIQEKSKYTIKNIIHEFVSSL